MNIEGYVCRRKTKDSLDKFVLEDSCLLTLKFLISIQDKRLVSYNILKCNQVYTTLRQPASEELNVCTVHRDCCENCNFRASSLLVKITETLIVNSGDQYFRQIKVLNI
jgi:hypothetical protein